MCQKHEDENRRFQGTWHRQSPEPGIWPDNHLKSSFRDSFGWPHRRQQCADDSENVNLVRPQTKSSHGGSSTAPQMRDARTASCAGSISARSVMASEAGSVGDAITPRPTTARSIPVCTFPNSPGTFTRIPPVCNNRPPINMIEQYVPPYSVDKFLGEKSKEALERKQRSPTTGKVRTSEARKEAHEFYVARDCVSAARYHLSFFLQVLDTNSQKLLQSAASARRYRNLD